MSKNVGNENLRDEQIEQIVQQVDYDRNGEINYSEFLSGTLTTEHLSKHNLHLLFNYLDTLNQGYISKESLVKTFQRSSKDYSEKEIEQMLWELEINPEERIDFNRFEILMMNILPGGGVS